MLKFNAKRLWLNAPEIERMIGRRAQVALTRYGSIFRRESRKRIKTTQATSKQLSAAYSLISSQDRTQKEKGYRALWRYSQKRETRSMPGGYPLARTRHPTVTIRNIQYGYDKARKSVVVGPVALSLRRKSRVPETLEYGTQTLITERQANIPVYRQGRDKRGRYARVIAGYQKAWVPAPADAKGAGIRRRTARVGQRPTAALTYKLLQSRKTLEQSIIYADKKLRKR